MAKETIDTMVNESIRFMEAIIEVAPLVLDELIRQLPKLMRALEEMIPKILRILDEMLPIFTPLLIKLFTIAAEVFVKVTGSLLKEAIKGWFGFSTGKGSSDGSGDDLSWWDKLKRSAKVAIRGGPLAGMVSAFADTPGPVRVSNQGLLARFAPGDTVIAAKQPQELLRQALMAVGSEVKMGTRRPPPSPPSSSATQGSGGSRIDIAVIAEGRVLDAVQMQAMERGHAPKIAKRLRKASGVKVGFNRGRYNKFAVNQS